MADPRWLFASAFALAILTACAGGAQEATPPAAGIAAQAPAPIHRIASLDDDDFSDLQFLKSLLAGRRVVMLGESAHGTAEFSTAKVRLIRFLHREMGFDVVAFESSMTGCDAANARIGELPPLHVMRFCTFGTWHTQEALALFEYLDAERKAGRRLDLAGFDVQNSNVLGQRAIASGFEGLLELTDPDRIPRLQLDEEVLVRGYPKGIPASIAKDIAERYESLAGLFEQHQAELSAGDAARERKVALAIQEGRSRAVFAVRLGLHDSMKNAVEVRDKGMADNLDFLLDRLYPGRRVVVWAHNFHIARVHYGSMVDYAMGEGVAQRRGAEVYSIGLFMGRGSAASNDRRRYSISPPSVASLEAHMAATGYGIAFADFTQARRGPGTAWMFEPTLARDWGTQNISITPASTYDGILYIDTVMPPHYL